MAYFGPFKKAFRAHRDLSVMQGNRKKIDKENLTQWISLALKKALITPNIRVGFKGCGIWKINFVAMKEMMRPSKALTNPSSRVNFKMY